ncbi:hypothetical protein [Methanosarcina sp. KYL-1]|uniref:hypothetical protein n=1 Tax=Methanosarcina sp. KYL-1 TaxID=2602068 RepID=UPI0021013951|nr:hypothetical protein [Methanosarcina sp. KYL-1]
MFGKNSGFFGFEISAGLAMLEMQGAHKTALKIIPCTPKNNTVARKNRLLMKLKRGK